MSNITSSLAAAAALVLLSACASSAAPPPNIVLIIADDLRVDDIPRAMPRIEALAEQGVVFDAAFTPLPLCGPARVSLLTGTLPRTHGIRTNDVTTFDTSDTIATRLQGAGYRTAVFGKLLNRHWRAQQPERGWSTFEVFRRHDEHGRAQSDVLAQQALACMAGPGPHFCYVGAVAPHAPNLGPERCDAHEVPAVAEGSNPERWAQRMSALCGLDDLVANVVEARGPDTWVIFTADNGWFWENGRTGKQELVLDAAQVPLIVWGPGLRGHHRREMVSLVDVSATILRLGNVSRGGLDGRSLLPLLREENDVRWQGVLEIEGQ